MKLLPISEWAKKNGLTKNQAVNLARAKKIPLTKKRVSEIRWFVPIGVKAKKITILDEKTGEKKKRWIIS